MKKTFIKVKRGLLTAEHVEKLGPRWALYLFMVDSADWTTGTVSKWTDKAASEAIGIPIDTVKKQRERLAEDGYIQCSRGFQSSSIYIAKWMNPGLPWQPKEPPHTDHSEAELAPHTDQHTDQSHSQPSIIPDSQISDGTQLRKMMDHVDEYPASVQGVVQDICEVWGHKPPAKKSSFYTMWVKGAREVLDACGEFPVRDVMRSVKDGWEKDGARVTITGPMSLVNMARAEAARMRQPSGAVEHAAHVMRTYFEDDGNGGVREVTA